MSAVCQSGHEAEMLLYVHRNRMFITDVRKPRTSSSTFTQLLSFCWGYSEHVGKMTDARKQKAEKASEMPIKHSLLAGNVQIG